MTGTVDTVVEDERWVELGVLADRTCEATLRYVGLEPQEFAIVVLGADDVRVAALNGQFRGQTRPTNVLSWPSQERRSDAPGVSPPLPEGPDLGDIALAWETCAREAAELGCSMEDRVTHLLVHGTLHLLGYDHETELDAELMEATEAGVLQELGLQDPYAT